MKNNIIIQIKKSITWLDEHKKSNSIVPISKVINSLTIDSVTLGDTVSDAYALMNELEDNYKIAEANFINEFEGSNAAAERAAEAHLAAEKRLFTEAKNTYKRLNTFLDRIDKICDAYRQMISVVKQTDLKNV